MLKVAGWLMVVGLCAGTPSHFATAANIDEIAYLSSKGLKELSSKAIAMLSTPSLGICGRRRELKITSRGANEGWPELIQSAVKRDQPSKKTIRVSAIGKSLSSINSAFHRLLEASGYHAEIPSDLDESVKSFKRGLKLHHTHFPVYSGQVRGVDSNSTFSFFAMADEVNNELLILSLGEELCR